MTQWTASPDHGVEAKPAIPYAVLLVEDNPVHARLVQAALGASAAGAAWDLSWVTSLAEALERPVNPDLVLLDLSLPDSRGLSTLARLRAHLPSVPVVLLTATDDDAIEARALEAGAQDFLGKDELTPRALRRALRYAIERHRTQAELLRLSVRDPLTDLLNRRGFLTAAEHHSRAAHRAGLPFVVIYADLDGLKRINDELGHAAGDAAIVGAAWILRQTFRAADVVARLGGDEFAVLVSDAGPEVASVVLQRLAYWEAKYNDRVDALSVISVSAGVAVAPDGAVSIEALLGAADAAAYDTKRRRKAAAAPV